MTIVNRLPERDPSPPLCGDNREGLGRRVIVVLRSEVWPKDKRLTVEDLASNERGVASWRAVDYSDYSLKIEILPSTERSAPSSVEWRNV